MDRVWGIRAYLLLPILASSTAACGDTSIMSSRADADVGGDVDGGELRGGVELRFATTPGIETNFEVNAATFSLQEVKINVSDLRLIGDAATGGQRTRIDLVKLNWKEDSGPNSSAAYPDAPPGLYSLVRGAVTQFEIYVDVERDDGDDFQLEIDYDEAPLAIDFALDFTVEAGMLLEVDVLVDLASLLSAVDINALEIDSDDKAEIDDDSPQLEELGELLSQSFTVQSLR